MLKNDVARFVFLMNGNNFYNLESRCQYLNQYDPLGNTLLILATKLYGLHKMYDELLKEVLRMNPDPFLKNSVNGWSAMDESLS